MNLSDRELLARTLQAEAGNQGLGGMLAAGSVVMNRANTSGYGNGLRGVILKPGQFSAWNSLTGYAGGEQGQDMASMRPSAVAYEAADKLLAGDYEDPTGGATHYYNPDISNPSWAKGKEFKRIGDHVFGFADAGQGMTTSTKGPQMMQEEKPRGLLGSLGIQKMEEGAAGETGQRFYQRDSFKDTAAILAQGFGRMGIMGMEEIADSVAKQRTENKARNKTAEYLDKYMPGAGDLVREGYFSAKDALSISMDKQSRELAQQAATALRAGNNQEAMAILTQLSPTAMGQQLATQMKPRSSEVIGNGRYTVTYDQDGKPQVSLNEEVIAAEQRIQAAEKQSAPLPKDARKSEEEDFEAIEAYDNLIQDIGGIAAQFGYNPDTDDFEGALRIGLDGLIKGGLGAIGLGRENVETAKARQQFDRFKTRLVNESLRLNKGVQTEGDAQRAARELGDAKTEATAYAAIQELLRINQRARANKVSAIERRRGRFGVGGVDIPAPATPSNIGWKVIDK